MEGRNRGAAVMRIVGCKGIRYSPAIDVDGAHEPLLSKIRLFESVEGNHAVPRCLLMFSGGFNTKPELHYSTKNTSL